LLLWSHRPRKNKKSKKQSHRLYYGHTDLGKTKVLWSHRPRKNKGHTDLKTQRLSGHTDLSHIVGHTDLAPNEMWSHRPKNPASTNWSIGQNSVTQTKTFQTWQEKYLPN